MAVPQPHLGGLPAALGLHLLNAPPGVVLCGGGLRGGSFSSPLLVPQGRPLRRQARPLRLQPLLQPQLRGGAVGQGPLRRPTGTFRREIQGAQCIAGL